MAVKKSTKVTNVLPPKVESLTKVSEPISAITKLLTGPLFSKLTLVY